MADQWYLARDNQKHGPYSQAQLQEYAKSGQLQPTDMLLKDGTTKWIPASQVKGLFPAPSPKIGGFLQGIVDQVKSLIPELPQAIPATPPPVPVATPLPAQPAEWHYAKGDQRHGPITEVQLRELAGSGQLLPTDLVWKAEMQNWAQASTVDGLFQQASPPPLPVPPPLPAKTDNAANKHDQQVIELLKKGRQKRSRGEYAVAIEAVSEAIRLDPQNADAYFERGLVYFEKGYTRRDFADAIPDLETALRLNPAHKKAQEHLEEAKKHLPQSPGQLNPVLAVPDEASHTSELVAYDAFLAQRPPEPVFVCADCQLGHKYLSLYENAAATHYNVRVGDLSKWKICLQTAYVAKESDAGKELFSILKDGLEHKLVLQVAFQGPDGTPSPEEEEFAILGTQKNPHVPKPRSNVGRQKVEMPQSATVNPASPSAVAQTTASTSTATGGKVVTKYLCVHCLTEYTGGSLRAGSKTTCGECGESFVVGQYYGEVVEGLFSGLNPLGWFRSEKCPLCSSGNTACVKKKRLPGYRRGDKWLDPLVLCFQCKDCYGTWEKASAHMTDWNG